MRDGIIAVLDAWNVAHKHPRFRARISRGVEAVREILVRYCAERLSRRRDVAQIWLVFDGGAPAYDEEPCRGIRVIHSGANSSADERIAMLVQQADRPTRYIVVSDDSEVKNVCRGLGANIRSVGEFFEADRGEGVSSPARDANDEKALPSPREQKTINEELHRMWGIDETKDG